MARAMEIVESALLFLTAQFVFVILYAIAHPAQAVVEPVATQIHGISPMLIIVRVSMGTSYEQTTKTPISSVRFGKLNRRAQTETDDQVGNESSAHHLELSACKGC
ncbi:hypothetical protein C8R44DRAFT_872232 [Mycena epipterygia]|nr:hypothetical protein C8R44DRAFT_872232 [Mycena epipterygia]